MKFTTKNLAASVSTIAVALGSVRAQAQIPPAVAGANTSSTAHVMQGSTIPDTFPYAIWQGLIVVPVMFGDGMPEQAVINTGMPNSVIVTSLAEKKNLRADGLSDVVLLDRTLRGSKIKPQLIRLDKFMVADVGFAICDIFSNISAQTVKDEPTVWLGNSALSATAITIDPRKMEITLRMANSPPPPKCTRVPFTIKDGRILVDVQIGKEKYEAFVDTGSATSLLPLAVAKKCNSTLVTTADIVDNKGKPAKAAIIKLAEVNIGKLKTKDVQAIYVSEVAKGGYDQDYSVIGSDLLMRYKVTIDYGHKEMYFEDFPPLNDPNKPNKDPVGSNGINPNQNRGTRPGGGIRPPGFGPP